MEQQLEEEVVNKDIMMQRVLRDSEKEAKENAYSTYKTI